MYVFTAESTHVRPTEWGAEVLRRLKERGQTQIDLIKALADAGYPIGKVQFCRLLRGNGASTQMDLILQVNAILDIPQDDYTKKTEGSTDGEGHEGAEQPVL